MNTAWGSGQKVNMIKTETCFITLGYAWGNKACFGLHPRATLKSRRAIIFTIARYPMQYSYIVN